jgi:GTPase SAR1 family protein
MYPISVILPSFSGHSYKAHGSSSHAGLLNSILFLHHSSVMGCCCCSAGTGDELGTRIAVLGLPGVGKTSLVEFFAGDYSSKDPPIETNGILQRLVEIHKRTYTFYDVCGYTTHIDEWLSVVRECEGALIVFDPLVLQYAKLHITTLFKSFSSELVSRRMPTLCLVNKTDSNEDVAAITEFAKRYLSGTDWRVAKVRHLDHRVWDEFEWLEKRLQQKLQ